jgi:hypothetical protein
MVRESNPRFRSLSWKPFLASYLNPQSAGSMTFRQMNNDILCFPINRDISFLNASSEGFDDVTVVVYKNCSMAPVSKNPVFSPIP